MRSAVALFGGAVLALGSAFGPSRWFDHRSRAATLAPM
jgi:hypothetical protein